MATRGHPPAGRAGAQDEGTEELMIKRWMAEIYYATDRPVALFAFEELFELQDIVEGGGRTGTKLIASKSD